METTIQTMSQIGSNHAAIMLGYKNQGQITFAEIKGTKDDIIEVLFAGLLVFAVGAVIAALLRG